MKEEYLEYEWEFGCEKLKIKVDSYYYGGICVSLEYAEPEEEVDFGSLTVKLPNYKLALNEAFIDDFDSENKCKFIKKYNLGQILPEYGYSGMCRYYKVAFNMERLAMLDKKGVEQYIKSIEEQETR